jgi:hypothetical protein
MADNLKAKERVGNKPESHPRKKEIRIGIFA